MEIKVLLSLRWYVNKLLISFTFYHIFRVQKLTLGVECTLHLLQAILRDEEFKANPDNLSSNDITLMYSTAIIRFINLISHSGQVDSRHQPISIIAAMVGIPDWLVR